jgi:hypothetical protein
MQQPEVPLPHCGAGAEDQCCAVVLNHQLFTQCTHRVSGEFTTEDGALNLCKGCFKSAGTRTKAGNKPLAYGTIAERLEKGGVTGNNGALRKPVTYANVMAKLGITEEQAVAAAEKMGWTIPDEELHPKPVARGRPKKEKAAVEVVADTSGSESENGDKTAAKKRGRPKKQKKVLTSAQGDDLIASLVEEAAQKGAAAAATSDEEATVGSDTSAESTVSKSDQKKQAAAEKKAAAEAAKLARAAELAAKKAEKEAAALAKKAEKEAAALAKKAEKEAAVLAKKAEKEATALAKKEAAAAKKKEKSAAPPPAADELTEEAEEEEDEEATQVVKWTCPADGKEYLKSADNVVYDAESHEAVGVWNEKENKIDELPAEEDGEDEDE